jgi:hypothetical protein
MQATSPAAPKRRLRKRARLLVQGIDAAAQTETDFDAGRVAPRVQADRQSAVIVDVRFGSKGDMCAAKRHVCFTLESGHVRCTRPFLLGRKADMTALIQAP